MEALFGEQTDESSTLVEASWSGDTRRRTATAQSRVMLARVRGKVVAVAQPGAHLTLAPAAGILQRARRNRADVATFQLPDEIDSTLLMSGCDPAAAILVDWLARRRSPVRAVALPCSSREALRALSRRPRARRWRTSSRSEEWRIQPGLNPPRIGPSPLDRCELCAMGIGPCDRARQSVRHPRFHRPCTTRRKTREPRRRLRSTLGARPRARRACYQVRYVTGYQFEVRGHLEVAAAIAAGLADAGVTIRLAADAYGLHFLPHQDERYDLVFMEQDAEYSADQSNARQFELRPLRARNQPAMRLRHRSNGPARQNLIWSPLQ